MSRITQAAWRCAVWVLFFFLLAWPAAAQSDAPETLFKNGLGQFVAGNYEEAAKYLEELVKFFGNEPDYQMEMETAYYALGCALYNQGRSEDAINAFKTYAEKYPQAKYRDEAFFRIAASQQTLEKYDEAVTAYGELLQQYPRSSYAEDSAFQIGMCRMLQDKRADAVAAFTSFMDLFPNSELWGQAGAFVARSLFDDGKPAEAVAMLQKIEQRPRSWNVVTYCNFLAFEIGDAAFDETDYDLALKAYRRVKTRKALLAHQRAQVSVVQAELEAFRRTKSTPEEIRARFQRERRLLGILATAEELLKKLEGMPDYDAGLFHRIGRCFFNTDRYWEARVAFARVVREATEDKLREAGHFDLILAISRLRRFDDLITEADHYLDRYDPNWKRD